MYAVIAVNAPVQSTFHYHIPPELEGKVVIGSLVQVAFGTAMQSGIVVALDDESPVPETKPVIELLDPDPVVHDVHIQLAEWMAERYLSPLGLCLWLFLPPGITGRNDKLVTPLHTDASNLDPDVLLVLDILKKKGPTRVSQLKRLTKDKAVANTVIKMAETELVDLEPVLSVPSIKPKMVSFVSLDIPENKIEDVVATHFQNNVEYLLIMDYLAQIGQAIPVAELRTELEEASSYRINKLVKYGFVKKTNQQVLKDSLKDRYFAPALPPQLIGEQQTVWDEISQQIHTGRHAAFLLHGVTGSGKTEIYLRAIEQVVGQGKQAIFLVPEIALTPQTIKRVAERFPEQVAVVHGGLPPRERFDTWYRARKGEINVIVGTRAGLFTPLPDLGLIVIDEEHDHSYKQSPPFGQPSYDTRDVAIEMMRLNQGLVILGSATPDVRTFYQAQGDKLNYLRLPKRIMGHRGRIEQRSRLENIETVYQPINEEAATIELPPVQIVDMREELKAGNRSIFSDELQRGLAQVLERGEQAILFLNRRGKSTYVFCRDCGNAFTCRRCDTPMTYHTSGKLKCHHCGYASDPPKICPHCGSRKIKYFGAGTQEVENEVSALFPSAKILRWDADTANKPELHGQILDTFINREADIMVGTQMIAKGLDLPLVTLVGVVSADLGLALPDFRAGERVFQLLMQVAGRAGRGLLGGNVILQTYQPDHYAIQAASRHDYPGFYKQEIAYRRELNYPPFRRMSRLLFSYTNPQKAQEEAQRAAGVLQRRIDKLKLTGTEMIGPVPCFFSRIDRNYRWHIILRGTDPTVALRDLALRPGWHLDIDPVDIL